MVRDIPLPSRQRLFRAVKRAVDANPHRKRFLLTSSVRAELGKRGLAPDLRGYVELAMRSGFPEAALRLSGPPRQAWLESYVEDLLTHDIETAEGGRRDRQRLRRYFEAYTLSSAGVTDHKTIYDAAE